MGFNVVTRKLVHFIVKSQTYSLTEHIIPDAQRAPLQILITANYKNKVAL